MSAPVQGYVAAELARGGYQNVHDLLTLACAKHPHRTAFSCGDDRLSYADLARQADAFARYLRHHAGLQPGDRLALQLPNSLQYPIATFGALKAGLVIVNTNPQYTAAEARHQFRDSGARAILVLDRLLPLVRAVQADTALERIILTSVEDLQAPVYDSLEPATERFMQALRLGEQSPALDCVVGLERLALLQYTGGTTGVSKGAMLSHRNLLANVLQTIELFDKPGLLEPEKDVRIAPLPLYHIMAFATNCLSSVGMGLHTVFIRDGRNLDETIGAMQRHPFSLLSGINTLFVGLMNHPQFRSIDFSHLKWATSGGAPLNSEVGRRWQVLTGAPIREGFGLTEASPVVATGTALSPYREGYIGQALIDTELRTVDDDGNDVPAESPGELWLRGPQVMQGYWQRPEETAKVITADGWLKTGDIALLDAEGFVKIVDRKKDMILVSGFNVFPNEIEDVLMQHPSVRECVAVGIPDARKGEAVKVFVSLREATDDQALLEHCRQFLTGYKLPSAIEIRDELPKTAVGKLLRRQLRDEARAAG
ncbi:MULTISPECIES: AMP-binding protein [Stutzerimonas]|uniref:Long-chain-fatty-acid--CoA ligase n=1 Tax=Stutzerimonas stutzeri (strain A1501) TaxID=379731 RepID=A4VFR2_STUS1|nr:MULTISPECIES: AMP-binding protein [Stutzerimonas]ABP77813.1 long-chain-fatty-acid--CoA ligase [Stutzerimonas stutzeri A1501]MCW8162119.1 long-chain fatty acid--CoA ligase [Stutzerimonas stutzeri]MDH0184065.1 AMP-binding protein [Stutzerimonas stutzeri]MDH1248596.1 AMP-binding protein [Stutzerimonas stutzeri]MDI9737380.1 AMP-binding protein [Stutzerimonas stutzeri]